MNKEMTKEEMYVNVAEDLIKYYGLDFGNAEAYVQDDCLFCSIEAPYYTKMSFWANEIKNETPAQCRKEITQAMIDAMQDFDPDKRFDEKWEEDKEIFSNYTKAECMKHLLEDKEFFDAMADEMERDIA